jgi:serine/threonine protein phosphatase PrpC
MLSSTDLNVPTVFSSKAATLPLRWGEYSRPGNDPMKRVKENQDSLVVVDGYGQKENQMFIGVFDGHGPNGGLASQFCRDRMPASWLASGDLDPDPFVAINRGCIVLNQELHMSNIDVYMSGTTAITSLLRDNHLFVANVGDSRAVLGRMSGSGTIKALDLSNDQVRRAQPQAGRGRKESARGLRWGAGLCSLHFPSFLLTLCTALSLPPLIAETRPAGRDGAHRRERRPRV